MTARPDRRPAGMALPQILDAAAAASGVSVIELTSDRREASGARHAAMLACRRAGHEIEAIAAAFRRDASTVRRAMRRGAA